MQNIEKVLDRGEKLELLVDKTENLRYQADQFQKGGKALRNKMWWQNIKMKLLVALILCVVVVIIVRSTLPAHPVCACHALLAPTPTHLCAPPCHLSSASHVSLAAAIASSRSFRASCRLINSKSLSNGLVWSLYSTTRLEDSSIASCDVNNAPHLVHDRLRQTQLLRFWERLFTTLVGDPQYIQTMTTC